MVLKDHVREVLRAMLTKISGVCGITLCRLVKGTKYLDEFSVSVVRVLQEE
jgi:hypothetical protein